jgi:hypothetical protein
MKEESKMWTSIVIAILTLAATCSCAQSAGCTASTLKGNYGFSTFWPGSFKDQSGVVHNGYVRYLGVFHYGGDGTVALKGKVIAIDNQTRLVSLTGEYSIDQLCTGSITLSGGDDNSKMTFVVVSGGNEVETVTAASRLQPFLQRKQ